MTSGRFRGDPRSEFEDGENSSDHSGDSVPHLAGDHKQATSSSSSLKKSTKALQKKVVSIPIKDLESSSRSKGEAAPPSDSWAWRKYGQKPIKGSPYPRGYYRCSSSKGCPARKQVERSRVDPTMLLVTYSSDHNHPWPPSSRTHHGHSPTSRHTPPPPVAAIHGGVARSKSDVRAAADTKETTAKDDNKFATINDDFDGWFSDLDCATMIESPMLAETSLNDTDLSMLFPIMGEEEVYLFADLDELPECSVVFRRKEMAVAAGATRWCGTTCRHV